MPKKLMGSLASGRIIILERNGLTLKEGGLIKKGDFIPYSSISSVSNDCPLIGYGKITFYVGVRRIEAYGFTRSQAKMVQDAVNAGCFDDSSEDSTDSGADCGGNSMGANMSGNNAPSSPMPKSYEQKAAEEEARLVEKTDEVLNMEVDPTNEDAMVKCMSALISILEANEGDNVGGDGEELKKLRKASMSKFSAQLAMLRIAFPENKLLPYFISKEEAFIALEKKKKRNTLILVLCLIAAPLLMFLIAGIMS